MRTTFRFAFAAAVIALAPLVSTSAAAQEGNTASGTMAVSKFNVAFKHVYLVAAPADGKTARRLIFSATDIGAGIAKCTTISCATNDLKEGLELEIDSPGRMNLWAVANGQKVQHSDTAPRDTLTTTTDAPDSVAGKLAIDKSASGGPKINIEFKAKLTKAFKG
jgi:hypothetical protein